MTDYSKGKYDAFSEVYSWLHYDYKFGRKSKESIISEIKQFCFNGSEEAIKEQDND